MSIKLGINSYIILKIASYKKLSPKTLYHKAVLLHDKLSNKHSCPKM